MLRAFAAHADAMPWSWGPQMLDEWLGELRGDGAAPADGEVLRLVGVGVLPVCDRSGLRQAGQCQARFDTHPVQVVHEWNAAMHVQDNEADPRKRAFTLDELQAPFDHAEAQVGRVHAGGRKGWLPVFRDAAALKVVYGFGLHGDFSGCSPRFC